MRSSPPSDLQGQIDPARPIQSHPARVLLALARAKRTGTLQLTASAAHPVVTRLVLVEGQIVFAESEEDSKRLIERLIAEGAQVSPDALELELELEGRVGWSRLVRANELAVVHGAVPPFTAQTTLAEVIRDRASSSFRMVEGAWTFADDPSVAAVPRYPVPFERLVIDALEHPDVAPVFERALARYARHYPRLEGDSQQNTTLFGMTPKRFRTVRLLDGTQTFGEVLEKSPMGPTAASALVGALTIFERIWWNAEPTIKAPSGQTPAQAASARSVAVEPASPSRPPAAEPSRSYRVAAEPSGSHRVAAPMPLAPEPSGSHRASVAPTQAASEPRSAAGNPLLAELLRRNPGAPTGGAPASAPSEALSPQARFERGKSDLAAGRLRRAVVELGHALAAEPGNTSYALYEHFARYLEATTAEDRSALAKESVAAAGRRLREVDNDAFAHHVLGRVAFVQGDLERALRAFKSAERLNPKDVETIRYQRLLLARQKK
ncbi:MAG: tetratricopeptide repeat protein [Deltaproteobacteria bacterium]